jgi:ABC-type lipoprotein export system ATPase subunit
LNLIAGIDKPTSGDISINGDLLTDFKVKDFNFYRSSFISLIFQDFNLLKDYSVLENIGLACRLQGKIKADTTSRSMEALKFVRMDGLANRMINSLSGGQQQRIAIARAIAKDSKIILCDEPTANLDSKASNEIYEIFKEVAKMRLVIVVSHDKDFARDFADRIITLNDGIIISDELLNNNDSQPCISNKLSIMGTKKRKTRISFRHYAISKGYLY